MTEASPMLLYPPVDGWKSGSAGILSPNTICKVGTVKINYVRKKPNPCVGMFMWISFSEMSFC